MIRNNKSPKPRPAQLVQAEKVFHHAGFKHVDAKRQNSVSVRIRVIDPRFTGRSLIERDRMVRELLAKLPPRIQEDLTLLLLLAPDEMKNSLINREFEDPTLSML